MLTVLWLLAIFAVGVVILYFGADNFLHGAVSIARRLGVSQLAIGLTLVAFGTSCPELSLDILAALQGTTDLAFGNLVGANIINVGLIMGVAAVISPLRIHLRLLRAELPIVIALSITVLAVALDGVISRQDGLLLLAAFVLFLAFSYRAARRESASVQREFKEAAEPPAEAPPGVAKSAAMGVGGLLALVIGAQFMVYSAVGLARLMGVSELVIGLTIVALGTTLPELATAVVASRRNEADIVVGNVIGSNIFNLMLVLAVVAVITPVPVATETLRIELPVMIAFVLALVPIMWRGMVVTRKEGLMLLSGFAAFLAWQFYVAIRGGAEIPLH